MQPFKLEPAFKDYLWGGSKLKTVYGKKTDCDPLAESWELSAHPDGPSVISTGPLAGMLFTRFVKEYPQEWSRSAKAETPFPLMVKLIDAQKSLSIQVHPNDDYAWRVEGEPGKTEMWVILDAEPDSFLYYGFTHEISREEFARRIEENTLTDVLNKQPVKPGEVYFIPAGTIHAIGAGIVLAEVQQSSNSTYRVYDFGRRGADGKLRPLHVEKALDVTQRKPANGGATPCAGQPAGTAQNRKLLASCPYFTVEQLLLDGTETGQGAGEFLAILCTDGSAALACDGEKLALAKGECLFVPASAPAFKLEGKATLLSICYKQ